jgi:NTP pyrophosphatase (non-canonical NTP hydrolase)
MNITELQIDVHQNAKDHGWWDEKRNHLEIMALVISECSELLEALRSKEGADVKCDKPIDLTCKEEETADIFIRVLDYCGHLGKSNEDYMNLFPYESIKKLMNKLDVGAQIGYIMRRIIGYFDGGDTYKPILAICKLYSEIHGFSLERAVFLKHEYNKGRPFKHGKKF